MNVLAIFGPTASGKTAVAEALADRIPAEIVSADSMQVYRGLPILTNQPERRRAWSGSGSSTTRHLSASTSGWPMPRSTRSSSGEDADRRRRNRALPARGARRARPSSGARARRAEPLGSPLRRRRRGARARTSRRPRPRGAAAVHPNDRRRVVRALELAAAGRSLAPEQDRLWTGDTRHPTLIFGLELPRRSSSGASSRVPTRCSRPAFRTRYGARSPIRSPRPQAGDGVRGGCDAARGRGANEALAQRTRATPLTSASGCGASRPC